MRTQYGLITYLLSFPDPRLRTIAEPVEEVTDEIRQLAADMFETMYEGARHWTAATQVDRHIQLIVMDLSEHKDEPLVFINPKSYPIDTKKRSPMKKAADQFPKYTTKLSARHA